MASGIATAPITAEEQWPIAGAPAAARSRAASRAGAPAAVESRGRGRVVMGWLGDAGLILLITLAFPLAILAVGTPLALFLRLLLAIAGRL